MEMKELAERIGLLERKIDQVHEMASTLVSGALAVGAAGSFQHSSASHADWWRAGAFAATFIVAKVYLNGARPSR